jgi:hypothetical protein
MTGSKPAASCRINVIEFHTVFRHSSFSGDTRQHKTELNREYASDFNVTDSDKITWHQLQEEAAEAEEQWAAARLHLRAILHLRPTDARFLRRLSQVETHLDSEAAKGGGPLPGTDTSVKP